jgi:hypothetical protein
MPTGTETYTSTYLDLRIEIAGRWTLDEFWVSMRSLSAIYRLYLGPSGFTPPAISGDRWPVTLFRFRNDSFPWWLDTEPPTGLYISRLQFASPGSVDLIGIASGIEHLKDIVNRFFDLFEKRDERRLENKRRELENKRRELENEGLKEEIEGKRLDNEIKRLEQEQKSLALRAQALVLGSLTSEALDRAETSAAVKFTEREKNFLRAQLGDDLAMLLHFVDEKKLVGTRILQDPKEPAKKRKRRKSQPGSSPT